MSEVKPLIHCVDYWPGRIPEEKLKAYQALIDEGQITKQHAIVNQRFGTAAIEYYSVAPHEWILAELAKRAEVTP